jgi:cation transport regulator ChaC
MPGFGFSGISDGGGTIKAWVYIYEGKNLIDEKTPPPERAAMVLKARGIRGSNFDYVKVVYEGLGRVGIDDPAVSEFWRIVKEQSERAKNNRTGLRL